MESKEPLQNQEESANHATNRFLKIKNIKVFSKAYYLRLKEGDIIIGLNGDNFNSTYDELKNILENDEKDKVGTTSEEIIFRFSQRINSSNHDIISKLKREIFNEIFIKYNEIEKEERDDFYHINKGDYLESDYLVYPLHQSIDKKGLLICEHPNDEIVLNKISESFIQILGNY